MLILPIGTGYRMHDLPEAISKRPRVAQVWPLLAVGLLGLAVVVAAWSAVSVWEERLARAKFNDVAGDYATVLQNGLNEYLDKIRALRAFYDASIEVDRREFALFTSQILAGYGDTMRLLWCPRVGRDERGAIERKARGNGLADFSIKAWARPALCMPRPSARNISRSSIRRSRTPRQQRLVPT